MSRGPGSCDVHAEAAVMPVGGGATTAVPPVPVDVDALEPPVPVELDGVPPLPPPGADARPPLIVPEHPAPKAKKPSAIKTIDRATPTKDTTPPKPSLDFYGRQNTGKSGPNRRLLT